MKTLKMLRVLGAVPVVVMAWSMSIGGQVPQALTAQDKAEIEIQSLVTGYAKSAGQLCSERIRRFFASGTGYFASGFRGHVVGRDRCG